MNKSILSLLIVCLGGMSMPSGANQMLSTPLLLKACNAPKESRDFGVCLGFFSGVVQAAIPATIAAVEIKGIYSEQAYQEASIAAGKVFGCGENDTIINSIEKYKRFMKSNVSFSDLPASVTVAKMLSSTYPCK